MFDTKDAEQWRNFVTAKKPAITYVGKYLSACQWAYLARNHDVYYLILVQSWFKKVTITSAGIENISDWELPPGEWVAVGDQNWQRYEVCDVSQI